jgi:uncharacterized protein YjbI with pentapeptide repeats
MANDEHVAMLKQGVDAWNAWRAKSHLLSPDLSGVTLRAPQQSAESIRPRHGHLGDMRGVHLRGADLRQTNLAGARLPGADLSSANLAAANLSWTYLMPPCPTWPG